MTKKEALAFYDKYSFYLQGSKHLRKREDLEKLMDDPVFVGRLERAAAYHEKHLARANAVVSPNRYTGPLERFSSFFVPNPGEPGAENNEVAADMTDMLHTPAGEHALFTKVSRMVFNGNTAPTACRSAEEALEICEKNPEMCEAAWTISKWAEYRASEKDPLLMEFYEENLTLYQGFVGVAARMSYLTSGLALLMDEDADEEDYAIIAGKASERGPVDEEEREIRGEMEKYIVNAMEEKSNGTAEARKELKERGILGQGGIYYRAYDEENKPIPMEDGIRRYAAKKPVIFRRRSPEEQEALRRAIQNPAAVPAEKDYGPLYGEGLSDELENFCADAAQWDTEMFGENDLQEIRQKANELVLLGRSGADRAASKQALRGLVYSISDLQQRTSESWTAPERNPDRNKSLMNEKQFADMKKLATWQTRLRQKLGTLALEDYKAYDERKQELERKAAAQAEQSVSPTKEGPELPGLLRRLGQVDSWKTGISSPEFRDMKKALVELDKFRRTLLGKKPDMAQLEHLKELGQRLGAQARKYISLKDDPKTNPDRKHLVRDSSTGRRYQFAKDVQIFATKLNKGVSNAETKLMRTDAANARRQSGVTHAQCMEICKRYEAQNRTWEAIEKAHVDENLLTPEKDRQLTREFPGVQGEGAKKLYGAMVHYRSQGEYVTTLRLQAMTRAAREKDPQGLLKDAPDIEPDVLGVRGVVKAAIIQSLLSGKPELVNRIAEKPANAKDGVPDAETLDKRMDLLINKAFCDARGQLKPLNPQKYLDLFMTQKGLNKIVKTFEEKLLTAPERQSLGIRTAQELYRQPQAEGPVL